MSITPSEIVRGPQFMPKFHRPWFRYIDSPDGGDGGDGGTGSGDGGDGGKGEPTFTQADVDRIIKERVQRVQAKYADYDEVKARAEGSRTLEERIATLESEGAKSVQRALRAEIAGEFGISTKRGDKGEPSQADLFLTGADEATLRAQAKALADMAAAKTKQNVAPREGGTTQTGNGDGDMREFVRDLFDTAD